MKDAIDCFLRTIITPLVRHRVFPSCTCSDHASTVTCPLWSPTPVALSAVGYLSKPKGEFITLFSAYSPDKALNPLIKKLPSIEGYGHAGRAEVRQDRRTVTQWALDLFKGGILTFGNLP